MSLLLLYVDWQQQTMPITAVLTTTRTEYRQQGRAAIQPVYARRHMCHGDAVE